MRTAFTWNGRRKEGQMEIESAIFNFQSLISVILLLICTCAYFRAFAPKIIDRYKEGLLGVFWKCARVGERLSPWVALSCFAMAFVVLFLK
ncbi:hypothetical protein WR25_15415 [Diploscapter pachys]|uniref:Protein kish n=1 Tax=Diploscapter pachys TaxID=2018661 RepID=A0A2A2LN54_9BILA|nr:hypothetical protein WR25_15415 [Diploscapter pachys]